MQYVERKHLPRGKYHEAGFIKRQVVDIDISKVITEYRAQILENEQGEQFIADFPEGVNSHIQYGSNIKAHAVYLSQYQLLPYNRITVLKNILATNLISPSVQAVSSTLTSGLSN
jgi:transposase